MCSRPLTWFCCLLAVAAPVLAQLNAAAQARAHHHAEHGDHAHEDDAHHHRHLPLHNPDDGGDPIPPARSSTQFSARPATQDVVEIPAILPIAYLASHAAQTDAPAAHRVLGFVDRRTRSPTAPAPGSGLPLLI